MKTRTIVCVTLLWYKYYNNNTIKSLCGFQRVFLLHFNFMCNYFTNDQTFVFLVALDFSSKNSRLEKVFTKKNISMEQLETKLLLNNKYLR